MDSLHAPWRIEYILAPKPVLDESLFTRIAQSDDDVGNLVIARGEDGFAAPLAWLRSSQGKVKVALRRIREAAA